MEPLITTIVTNPTAHPKHYPWVVSGGLALNPLTSIRLPFEVYTAATDSGKKTLLADLNEGRVIISYEIRSDIKVLGKVTVNSGAVSGEGFLVAKPALDKQSAIEVQTVEEERAEADAPKKAFNLFEAEKNIPFKNSLTVGEDATAAVESAFSKTAPPEPTRGEQPGTVSVPLRKIF